MPTRAAPKRETGCLSRLFLLLLLAAATLAPAAAQSSVRAAEPAAKGLLELAAAQGIHPISGPDQTVFLYAFSRSGVRRNTLTLTPGTVFSTGPLAMEDPVPCVSLWIGMPFNLGDGAILIASAVSGEQETELVRVEIDPAHRRSDRAWIPLRILLPQNFPAGKLRFRVTEGPRGDTTGDWVGLAPGSDPACLLSAPPSARAGKR